MRSSDQNSRKRGWALVGGGGTRQQQMARAIRANDGDIRWIVGKDVATAKKEALDVGAGNATSLLADVLNDPLVDAVYLGDLSSFRPEEAATVAESGRHLLCDRALAMKSTDALTMIKTCERLGLVLGSNLHLRCSAIHRQMRHLISSGAVGDVYSVTMLNAIGRLPGEPRKTTLPEPTQSIYLDLSVADIDLARFLLNQEPLTVMAVGACIAPNEIDPHDHAMYSIVMSGGSFLQVHESTRAPLVESEVLVIGSLGYLRASGTLGNLARGTLVHGSTKGIEPIRTEHIDLYTETISFFTKAIDDGQKPLGTAWDGLASLTAAEAVMASAVNGRAVNVSSGIHV